MAELIGFNRISKVTVLLWLFSGRLSKNIVFMYVYRFLPANKAERQKLIESHFSGNQLMVYCCLSSVSMSLLGYLISCSIQKMLPIVLKRCLLFWFNRSFWVLLLLLFGNQSHTVYPCTRSHRNHPT